MNVTAILELSLKLNIRPSQNHCLDTSIKKVLTSCKWKNCQLMGKKILALFVCFLTKNTYLNLNILLLNSGQYVWL